jgi:hydrogenase-4 component B
MQLDLGSSLPLTLYLAANATWIAGIVLAIPVRAGAGHKTFAGLLMAGALLLIGSVIAAWPAGFDWTAPRPVYLGLAPVEFRLDALTAPFLLMLSLLAIAVALFSPGYLKHLKDRVNLRIYWACTILFVFAMGQVIASANGMTFLVFWEVMSLSSVALVAAEPIRQRAQKAALIYLGATRVSTALITGAFVYLAASAQSWNFAQWNMEAHSSVPAIVLFFGLCIKAGVWPFHIWLPYAHPEAPAPVSSLMSGVMVKVAIYGMIRFFILGNSHSEVIAYLAIFLGIISGVWGVLFALMQHDLKKLLAYSTVENVGLIVAAIGLSLHAKTIGVFWLAEIALAAAILHSLNHACFKGLLFLGAGAVDSSAHTRDLGYLGGLAKNMPWTMAFFLIGSAAISALPPLNGFASKWLVYQSFLNLSFRSENLLDHAIGLSIVGVLSLIGALSLACFTKAVGISFLGRPRSEQAVRAHECSFGMKLGQGFLCGLCVVLGVVVPYAMHLMRPILQEAMATSFQPAHFFTIPQPVLCLIGFLTAVSIFFLSKSVRSHLRSYVTWDCGYGDLPSRAEETGTSFSQPIGRIFGALLQYKTTTEIRGRDRRHFPEGIQVDVEMFPLLEIFFYNPTIKAMQSVSTALVKMQTASIHVHLLYVFISVLILVVVGIYL